ncbi:MAG TPA: hypothetical protein PKW60_13400 [Candidatus Hydrogenedentes bacterium]|nr:hypothetical protein [Candidatus Hydrogenedentota bacterium]
MNPNLQKHFDNLDHRLDALEDLLAAVASRTDKAEEARQQALEEQLQQRKQLVTLQHKADAYDSVRTDHENLLRIQQEMRERLRKLLALTKALGTEMRP